MKINEQVPKEKVLDNSIALLSEGNLFIKNRTDKYQSDIFITRLLGKKVICMSGQEAAKIFYNTALFQRNGAAPKRIKKTLFGENSVQSMDGTAHQNRKQLFLSVTTAEHQKQLSDTFFNMLTESISDWEMADSVILFDETKFILFRAACQWAGVPCLKAEARERSEDFNLMIDAFGAVGPRHLKGRAARVKSEAWLKNVIEDVRNFKAEAAPASALHTVAFFKDQNGKQLDSQTAAVELINIIRPIVAISTFITFAALALYKYPQNKEKIISEGDNYIHMFVQEIRRYYPFGPLLSAKVYKNFVWKKCFYQKGTLVMLDLYGTNHDPRIWKYPNTFQPERFRNWNNNSFNFIPQGGSSSASGHRCPGEGFTVEIMKRCVDFLVNKISYEVPAQDLSYDLARMPSLPKSGFIMCNIKRK